MTKLNATKLLASLSKAFARRRPAMHATGFTNNGILYGGNSHILIAIDTPDNAANDTGNPFLKPYETYTNQVTATARLNASGIIELIAALQSITATTKKASHLLIPTALISINKNSLVVSAKSIPGTAALVGPNGTADTSDFKQAITVASTDIGIAASQHVDARNLLRVVKAFKSRDGITIGTSASGTTVYVQGSDARAIIAGVRVY